MASSLGDDARSTLSMPSLFLPRLASTSNPARVSASGTLTEARLTVAGGLGRFAGASRARGRVPVRVRVRVILRIGDGVVVAQTVRILIRRFIFRRFVFRIRDCRAAPRRGFRSRGIRMRLCDGSLRARGGGGGGVLLF